MVLEYMEGYKNEIMNCIEDIKHKNKFYKQIPNLLTFIRLIGGIPAGFMFYINPKIFIGTISFLWFTDLIDGPIARKFNIQSKLGADMDALADKIMFLGSSIPLIGSVPVLILNFLMEGIISGINVFGRMKDLNTKTVFSGKVKTVSLALTLIFGYLVQYLGLSSFVFGVLISLTSLLQVTAIKDYISEFKKMEIMKEKEVENIIVNDIDLLDRDKFYEKEESLIDELRKEKEFYLGFKEQDIVNDNKRVMKKG